MKHKIVLLLLISETSQGFLGLIIQRPQCLDRIEQFVNIFVNIPKLDLKRLDLCLEMLDLLSFLLFYVLLVALPRRLGAVLLPPETFIIIIEDVFHLGSELRVRNAWASRTCATQSRVSYR